jgi:ABC-type amino acid transport substrate-binding protein
VNQQDDGSLAGFSIDLLNSALGALNICYSIYVAPGGVIGELKNDSFTGVIGELQRGNADLATGAITVTSSRGQVVRFTLPFLSSGLSLLVLRPNQTAGFFTFLSVFAWRLWLAIALAMAAVTAAALFVVQWSPFPVRRRYSPHEPRHQLEARASSVVRKQLRNTLGNPTSLRRSWSAAFLGFGFSFFILILIATYTANLAAFLTTTAIRTPIASFDDLRDCGCRFGVRSGTAQSQLFRTSPLFTPYLPQVVLFNTTDEGVAALQNRTIEAFLGDTAVLDYIAQHQPCDTVVVGPPFASGYYSLALAANLSDLSDRISLQLLAMQDSGDVDLLYRKWWRGLQGLRSCRAIPQQTVQLGFYSLRGLFALLGAFVVVALLIFCFEIVWHYCLYTPRRYLTDPKRCADGFDIFLGGAGALEV